MDTQTLPTDFEALRAAVEAIARDVAASNAADVDTRSRFPTETIEALKRVGALSAPVPREYGGLGLGMTEMGRLCATIAAACGSSGMVLAMHYIQVGCIGRHHGGVPELQDYLREIVATQPVLASMTSEVGTWGSTRTSICAVEYEGDGFTLNKDATTGSYCAQADAILVTCRRAADAPASDQMLVIVRKGDYTLTQTTQWNTMGMRGTCSPGFKLESRGPRWQVLPVPYADISACTMVPWSHTLWAALWSGIAGDAVARAGAFVRQAARRTPGETPPSALRLSELRVQLQAMQNNWKMVAAEYDALVARGADAELLGMGWALKFNQLKIGASEAAPQLVHKALQILGIAGYRDDGPWGVGRHYRDSLSGALMVTNERIHQRSASILTVLKDE